MQNNTFSGLFVGQHIVKLLRVDSTNSWIKNNISNSAPFPEGTVILAEEQLAGRGQQYAKWVSEPGKNLTFSILLKPHFLNINSQFELNKAICIALTDVLTNILHKEVTIKWPNDIYVEDKKIAGILIENSIQGNLINYAIIGIGLNVNQIDFGDTLNKKATSVKKILQADYDLKLLLNDICNLIEVRYLQLKHKCNLNEMYKSKLYRLNKLHEFIRNGEHFKGIIRGVGKNGHLQVESNLQIHEFGLKEIEFVIER